MRSVSSDVRCNLAINFARENGYVALSEKNDTHCLGLEHLFCCLANLFFVEGRFLRKLVYLRQHFSDCVLPSNGIRCCLRFDFGEAASDALAR